MSNKIEYYEQGDVLIFKINKLPDNVKKITGTTLAYGESTGHHHSLYDVAESSADKFTGGQTHSKQVNLYEDEMKTVYAEILAPVFLKHQEHKPIEFKPGIYRIGIVREYDHFEKLARKVVD